METYSIGQLAKAVGVNVETIRYYQRQGFIAKPTKRGVGYRKYVRDDALRVLFIKEAQHLGFSLKETRELLALRVNSRTRCAEVRLVAEHKIAEIQEKIRSLTIMQKALRRIAGACLNAEPTEACPILQALESTISPKISEEINLQEEANA